MLSYMDELIHYGVKGMRWGIRKERSRSKVNDIFRTMSDKERYYLVDDEKAKEYATKEMYDRRTSTLVASYIKSVANKPVAFLDVYNNERGVGEIAVGVNSNYRGQGHAKALVQKMIADSANLPVSELRWNANAENLNSIRLAEATGFKRDETTSNDKVASLKYRITR